MRGIAEENFARHVEQLALTAQGREQLPALLEEAHPAYQDRTAAALVRMRGWVMLALAQGALPTGAVIFLLDELQNGRDAYLVAAAARALRASADRSPEYAVHLVAAIGNMRSRHDHLDLTGYGAYAVDDSGVTPVTEILATLRWLGPAAAAASNQLDELFANGADDLQDGDRVPLQLLAQELHQVASPADCCDLPPGIERARQWLGSLRPSAADIVDVVLEDQSGLQLRYADYFRDLPTLVVFFYVRCDNPSKCPLSISRLAQAQAMLDALGLAGQVKTAAISYDPDFDRPDRLHAYGLERGLRFEARHRMFRVLQGQLLLDRYFRLGVSRLDSLVNRHRIEAYLVDGDGRIVKSFERMQWSPQDLVASAQELLEAPAATRRKPSWTFPLGAFAGPAAVFFPKCPMCWAAYASALGIGGVEAIPYSPWLLPVFLGLMGLNLASLWWRERRTGDRRGFAIAGVGALLLSPIAFGVELGAWSYAGLAIFMAGSLIGALRPGLLPSRWATALLDLGRLTRRAGDSRAQ